MASKKTVLIVDDHPIFRHGLSRLLSEQPDLVPCGEAANKDDALKLAQRHRPDIALVDIALDGTNGIELTKAFREIRPDMPVLVVTVHQDPIYAERAFRAGAKGFMVKQEPVKRLIVAIHKVLSGEPYVSECLGGDFLQRVKQGRLEEGSEGVKRLSDRELEVFQLIGTGRNTRQIAELLGLSIKTIESYRAHIKEKLDLETSYQLIQAAIAWTQGHLVDNRP